MIIPIPVYGRFSDPGSTPGASTNLACAPPRRTCARASARLPVEYDRAVCDPAPLLRGIVMAGVGEHLPVAGFAPRSCLPFFPSHPHEWLRREGANIGHPDWCNNRWERRTPCGQAGLAPAQTGCTTWTGLLHGRPQQTPLGERMEFRWDRIATLDFSSPFSVPCSDAGSRQPSFTCGGGDSR